MSAIWGFISFNNSINDSISSKMRSAYSDCKIDSFSEYTSANVHFASGIQYITAESLHEVQPISSGDFVFAADCIVDNRYELNCSAEEADGTVIFNAISSGSFESAVKNIRGIFSIALFDKSTNTLTLATDSSSSRCLFYYRHSEGITFSSILEGILSVHPDVELNKDYLKDFLLAPGLMPNISGAETPYKDIYKIEPGTYITFTKDSTQKHAYFAHDDSSKLVKCKSPEEYGKAFYNLFSSCVKDVLRSSKETGIALSSGFDSASVGALASDILGSQNKDLYAYTYVPSENTGKGNYSSSSHQIMDETAPVKALIEMHPNILPHFLNNGGKNSLTGLKTNSEIMEIPYKAYGNLPSLCELYENAYNDGCRIVLNGQFGNSTVSHGYIDDVLYDLYKSKHFIKFAFNLNNYSKHVKESRKQAFIGCRRYFEYSKKVEKDTSFSYAPSNPFVREDILSDYSLEERFSKAGINNNNRIPKDWKFYQFELTCAPMFSYIGEMETKMSLKYGIVLRDPTRDSRMIQFCYNLPYELFAHNGEPRWLIRHNLSELLPEAITGDWLRYGVQNSDFLKRVQRDWSEIHKELSATVKAFSSGDFTDASFAPDIKKMQEFLDNHVDTLPDKDELLFDNFMYAYILVLFLNSAPAHFNVSSLNRGL